MNHFIRLFAAWIVPCMLLAFTARAQQDSSETAPRHLVTEVSLDTAAKTATITVRLLYPCRLSLSLQNEQNRTMLRIVLNERLEPGTHRFSVSTEGLKPGDYTLRAQDGSDVKTQPFAVR